MPKKNKKMLYKTDGQKRLLIAIKVTWILKIIKNVLKSFFTIYWGPMAII